jgi:hypothetical protein
MASQSFTGITKTTLRVMSLLKTKHNLKTNAYSALKNGEGKIQLNN